MKNNARLYLPWQLVSTSVLSDCCRASQAPLGDRKVPFGIQRLDGGCLLYRLFIHGSTERISKMRRTAWGAGKRDWGSARRLAWGDLQNEWHTKHGRQWPSWLCAGCEKPIAGLDSIDLPDGNRVHVEPLDCMIEFGRRWRGDADRALSAFGLETPEE